MNTILSLNLDQIDSLINHVKALAFNRSFSSTGEMKAAQYIKNEMDEKKIDCTIEYFAFTGAKRVFTVSYTHLTLPTTPYV